MTVDAELEGSLHDVLGETRAHDEPRAGIDDAVDVVGGEHGSGSDDEVGDGARGGDRAARPGVGAQRDLGAADAAAEQRFGEGHGAVGVVDAR